MQPVMLQAGTATPAARGGGGPAAPASSADSCSTSPKNGILFSSSSLRQADPIELGVRWREHVMCSMPLNAGKFLRSGSASAINRTVPEFM